MKRLVVVQHKGIHSHPMSRTSTAKRTFSLQQLPLDRVELGGTNVRRREITAGLDELADSIRELGQQQPIIVQPDKEAYEVLVGQRRYLALKKLNAPTILALVPSRPYDREEAVIVSLAENVHRQDLEPGDKADAIAYLYERYKSQAEVARRLGISQGTVRRWLGFHSVPPELREMVNQDKISRLVATRIAEHITDPDRAVEMARYLAEKQPPTEQRTRIFDALVEHGDRPVAAIVEEAEANKDVLRIKFVLTARHARRMSSAAEEQHRDASDLAREATIEWLEHRR